VFGWVLRVRPLGCGGAQANVSMGPFITAGVIASGRHRAGVAASCRRWSRDGIALSVTVCLNATSGTKARSAPFLSRRRTNISYEPSSASEGGGRSQRKRGATMNPTAAHRTLRVQEKSQREVYGERSVRFSTDQGCSARWFERALHGTRRVGLHRPASYA